MTNGALFDAYALLFGLAVAATTALFYALRGKHRGRSEEADAKLVECHCRLVESPCDWANHPSWGLIDD